MLSFNTGMISPGQVVHVAMPTMGYDATQKRLIVGGTSHYLEPARPINLNGKSSWSRFVRDATISQSHAGQTIRTSVALTNLHVEDDEGQVFSIEPTGTVPFQRAVVDQSPIAVKDVLLSKAFLAGDPVSLARANLLETGAVISLMGLADTSQEATTIERIFAIFKKARTNARSALSSVASYLGKVSKPALMSAGTLTGAAALGYLASRFTDFSIADHGGYSFGYGFAALVTGVANYFLVSLSSRAIDSHNDHLGSATLFLGSAPLFYSAYQCVEASSKTGGFGFLALCFAAGACLLVLDSHGEKNDRLWDLS